MAGLSTGPSKKFDFKKMAPAMMSRLGSSMGGPMGQGLRGASLALPMIMNKRMPTPSPGPMSDIGPANVPPPTMTGPSPAFTGGMFPGQIPFPGKITGEPEGWTPGQIPGGILSRIYGGSSNTGGPGITPPNTPFRRSLFY